MVHPSHSLAADGIAAIPADLDGRTLFPWIHGQLQSGEPLILSGDDLPPEAGADRESFAQFGIRWAAAVPLLLQGSPQYLLCLAVLSTPRQWQDHCRTCHEGQDAGKFQFRIRRHGGRIVWLEHVCRPVLDQHGQFQGTRVSNRDVSERKQAEEALQAALAEITTLKERLATENVYLYERPEGRSRLWRNRGPERGDSDHAARSRTGGRHGGERAVAGRNGDGQGVAGPRDSRPQFAQGAAAGQS